MMKGSIQPVSVFIGGLAPSENISVIAPSHVIAADSGLHTARAWGLEVDMVVGDMDSIDVQLLEEVSASKIEKWDAAKDYSDTEIALMRAKQYDNAEITLVGGGGGRVDHFLSILSSFQKEHLIRRWITDVSWMEKIDSEVLIRGEKGMTLSFFPLEEGVLHTEGLKWNLRGKLSVMSLSNVLVDDVCRITKLSGSVALITDIPSGKTLGLIH